jgi:hypothetical protein
VTFNEHRAMFRPRDSHDLRELDAQLVLSPPGEVRWIQKLFSNSITLITFAQPATELRLESLVEIEHHRLSNPEMMMREDATSYPFRYDNDQIVDLLPTLQNHYPDPDGALGAWGTSSSTRRDHQHRGAAGPDHARDPAAVPLRGAGRARDAGAGRDARAAQRHLPRLRAVHDRGGALARPAARCVSGYLYDPALDGAGPGLSGAGPTHAWVQVYLPGAGWGSSSIRPTAWSAART